MENYNCVHCGKIMDYTSSILGSMNMISIPFCNHPECPNYGLLQAWKLPATPTDKVEEK